MAKVNCPNCDETFEIDVRPQSITTQVRKMVLTFPTVDVPHECPNNTFAPAKTKTWRRHPELDDDGDTAVTGKVKL